MKTTLKDLFLTACALFFAFVTAYPVLAGTGELLARYDLNLPDSLVTDPDILAGLPDGAHAVSIQRGSYLNIPIPSVLKDRAGHPYTLVLKIKTRITGDWVSLVNMPDSNDSDAMIYLDKSTRKVCIKQFDKATGTALMSNQAVELDRWTVLAFAFDTNATTIYLDGEVIFSGTGKLAESYADCYSAGEDILIGADNNGEDAPFYLADIRLYDGAVAAADELLGSGRKSDPFRIATAADWALFASNVNRGMAAGNTYPYYRLMNDIGSSSAPITQRVGTDDHPFFGHFDGGTNTIHVAIAMNGRGAAPFARTDNAIIDYLTVTGSVEGGGDHAAGLVGICKGTTVVNICNVAAQVSVSNSGYAGGIIGHAGNGHVVELVNSIFSGSISGSLSHAGGLIGWSDSLTELNLGNCIFKGSLSGADKCHPIMCMSPGSTIPVHSDNLALYYLNTVTPTEDAGNIVPGAEGIPVSVNRVPFEWGKPVMAVDRRTYFKSSIITLTATSGDVLLENGDVLTGTGGPDTHVFIAAGATVALRDVTITAIPDDQDHSWPGITCQGDVTIILQGDNTVKGGHKNYPGIFPCPDHTLVIQGEGTLNASSNGFASGIGAGFGQGMACGNIVIEGGIITATGADSSAGIGGSLCSDCGDITISGGTVTATGGQHAPGIGCSSGASCGDITISGGTVTATGGQNGAGIGSGPKGYSGTGMTCGDITLSGGTITATGGENAPGIGAGSGGYCGDIVIDEWAPLVITATGGDNSPNSVGAGYMGTCGTVTVGEMTTGKITDNPYVYNSAGTLTTIRSLEDWNLFTSRVNRGVDAYSGKTVTLAATFTASRSVGTDEHPFCGTFDGGGYTLDFNLEGFGLVAPFAVINGATIRNLTVTGTVSSDHLAGGLVGTCSGVDPNAVSNCTVSATVRAPNYAGGIVGHGGNGTLAIEGCVFSGTISNFTDFAGGILGGCYELTLTINNCLMKGTFTPSSEGRFHPIACRFDACSVTATSSGTYYLDTLTSTISNDNLIATAAGEPVSTIRVPFEWTRDVIAADGRIYYRTAVVTLTEASGSVKLHHGDILTGTGGRDTRVVIASDASVILRDVDLTAITDNTDHAWAGITCEGNVTLILEGVNNVRGGAGTCPGIQVPQGSTLTIQGDGRLDAESNGSAAGIAGTVTVAEGLLDIADGNTRIILPGVAIADGADNAPVIAHYVGQTVNVWLSGRTLLRDGSWNPLCLPFPLGPEQIAASPLAGAVIKELDGSASSLTDGALALNFDTAISIMAGRPYLVRWEPVVTIRSTADWDAFAWKLNNGLESYAGKLVKLDADITVSTMAGVGGHPFCGVFDGKGHTLTVDLSGEGEGIALFYAINGATIQNVKVTGSIRSSFLRPATFASFVEGSCTIQGCWSDVAILSTNSGWSDAGAMVARVNSGASLLITDCLFTGSVQYRGSYEGGGMVGWTQANALAELRNCLFSPSAIEIDVSNDDSYVFVSGVTRGRLSNCYYNLEASRSYLQNEGVLISVDDTTLAASLGNGWTVQGAGVIPKMNIPAPLDDSTALSVPLFMGVTIDTASAPPVEAPYVEFVGNTSPVAFAADDRSVLLIGTDGTLAYPVVATTLNACRASFRLKGYQAGKDVTRYTLNFGEESVTGEFADISASPYELWAAENGITGAWDERDASGVYNVFRYAFGKAAGAFTNPPLLAITIEDGEAVIHTLRLVNTDGYTFSILATDTVDGGRRVPTSYPLDPSGRTVIPASGKKAQFFRLKVTEK